MSDRELLPLTEASIRQLVDAFYSRVQIHPTLGPVFNAVVDDWDAHKETLTRFWSSVVLKTHTYNGNPMRQHQAKGIELGHFAVWLELWGEVTASMLEPEAAQEMQHYADRIGHSLKYGLGLTGAHGGRSLGINVLE